MPSLSRNHARVVHRLDSSTLQASRWEQAWRLTRREPSLLQSQLGTRALLVTCFGWSNEMARGVRLSHGHASHVLNAGGQVAGLVWGPAVARQSQNRRFRR